MTLSSARLAILVAILFLGCADDSTRLAGGTGSDLPRPTARLLDTNLIPVPAKIWRLWKIVGDSAYPSLQIADPAGFQLPKSGLWLVEAWDDSSKSGTLDGLKNVKSPDSLGRCAQNLTYLANGTDSSSVGVQPCSRVEAPSLKSRGDRPAGVGVFSADGDIRRVIRITGDHGLDAYRFVVWRVLSDSLLYRGTPNNDTLVKTQRREFRVSSIRGTIDITLPKGNWILEGWVSPKKYSTIASWEASIPDSMWA